MPQLAAFIWQSISHPVACMLCASIATSTGSKHSQVAEAVPHASCAISGYLTCKCYFDLRTWLCCYQSTCLQQFAWKYQKQPFPAGDATKPQSCASAIPDIHQQPAPLCSQGASLAVQGFWSLFATAAASCFARRIAASPVLQVLICFCLFPQNGDTCRPN